MKHHLFILAIAVLTAIRIHAGEILYSGVLDTDLKGQGRVSFDIDDDGRADLDFSCPPWLAVGPDGIASACLLTGEGSSDTNTWATFLVTMEGESLPTPLEMNVRLCEQLPQGYEWTYGVGGTLLSWTETRVGTSLVVEVEGPWAGVSNGYFGVRMVRNGLVRYGWLQASGDADTGVFVVHDHAAESEAGRPLYTGRRNSRPSIEGMTSDTTHVVFRAADLIPGNSAVVQCSQSALSTDLWHTLTSVVPASVSCTVSVPAVDSDRIEFFRIVIEDD